jgi:hypothetical protein
MSELKMNFSKSKEVVTEVLEDEKLRVANRLN